MSSLALACGRQDETDEKKNANYQMISTILKYNPSLNLPDKLGRTPLHFAAANGNATAVGIMIIMGSPQEGEDGQMYQPKEHLNIDACTIGGETALMKAAEFGSYDCCQYLLLQGADPMLKDILGRTALDHSKTTKNE